MGALTDATCHQDSIRSPPDDRRLTIVLAEDDQDMREMLGSLLRRDGHLVLEICDGRDLMAAIICGRLEGNDLADDFLLVTDLRMPGVDGLSAIKAARSQGKQLPFILMTAFGDVNVHDEAQRMGALAVFDKPFDFDDLRGAVRGWRGSARKLTRIT
jgi:DNA-binding NtrC family response regulator